MSNKIDALGCLEVFILLASETNKTLCVNTYLSDCCMVKCNCRLLLAS